MTEANTSLHEQGELFSILLRLHPSEPGRVSPGSGSQVHAAFLDIVRQNDPALAEQLHEPDQRRPFTVSLLQGFNHLSQAQLAEAISQGRQVPVLPGQVYWLRFTMLDAAIFGPFVRHFLMRSQEAQIRIGDAQFQISRIIGAPEPHNIAQSWAAYSTFGELRAHSTLLPGYQFEFATPTAFSLGQKSWGKQMNLFPEPALVFGSLARQWDNFAPPPLKMSASALSPRDFATWCEDALIVNRYQLETRTLHSKKFGNIGFQGKIGYDMKGNQQSPEAHWLTPLARFAIFSGVGYKTTMGMGQLRCTNFTQYSPGDKIEKEHERSHI